MLGNAMDRESAIQAAWLVRAHKTGTYAFANALRQCTINRTEITHASGMKILICDRWYEHLTISEDNLVWMRRDFVPVSSSSMMIFAAAEEWKMAASVPTRQVTFLVARDGCVVAHEGGVLFYISPTLQDFWTADVVFEYENAIFPLCVQKYVKQAYVNLDEFVELYNRIRINRVIMEARDNRNRPGKAVPLKVNRYMKMIASAAAAVAAGDLPVLFSDRAVLHAHVDLVYLDMYWRTRRGARLVPISTVGASRDLVRVHGNSERELSRVEQELGTVVLSRPVRTPIGLSRSHLALVPFSSAGREAQPDPVAAAPLPVAATPPSVSSSSRRKRATAVPAAATTATKKPPRPAGGRVVRSGTRGVEAEGIAKPR
ncbi:pR38 [rat cytomegalovirus strain Maastricht]|uniref:PR38 n=1 Tax=Rat cytomegalovirus (strain Maastricht) TaxID=79700 RepID=Q9DWF3_RCMVM|nr:pR38 [rat cytomegalovirus strain Maastricht]AAF99136.1 pR38 [rat cytomegalovirus strain Maastricht]WEG71962.1 protein UL38 [Murid betaherpesvirus 2]